jgi:hypothetical protein
MKIEDKINQNRGDHMISHVVHHGGKNPRFWRWVTMSLPRGDDFYMLSVAAICWETWKCRNRVCFDKKPIENPGKIMFSACAFMKYWACLYLEEAQRLINNGVKVMMRTTLKLLGKDGD